MKMDEPWNLEPDFKRWIDPETGLKCAIVRSSIGALCGYVRVPVGSLKNKMKNQMKLAHSMFNGRLVRNCGYGIPALKRVEVHGGLTFAGTSRHYRRERGLWVGFDCSHYGDLSPGLLTFEHSSIFNTVNSGLYRDFAYVTAEVTSLARQIKDKR
jgi:hypothetical protein